MAAATRAAAREQKAEEARRLADALDAVLGLHRVDFPAAQRPLAPRPPEVSAAEFVQRHLAEAKAATSVFARAERKAALAEAHRRAEVDAENQRLLYASQEREWQASLDASWEQLNANDVDAVLAVLAEAFEDNEAAAAAVGVEDSEVSLVILVPPLSAIPERRPTTTPAGNLSLKKFTKRETADLYKHLVCGHVLVTVKEAFAVAPGLNAARVVAVRVSERDAYGNRTPEVVLATRLQRSSLHGIRWAEADAVRIVNDAATDTIMKQKGASQELVPIDLAEERELRELVAAIDVEEMAQD